MTTHDDAPPDNTTRRHLHPVEPPFDPEYDTGPTPVQQAAQAAERALLGTLLTNPHQADTILGTLNPTDLYHPAHEAIWNAATTLHTNDVTPDHPALLNQLANNQTFQRAGGHTLLLELRPEADTTAQPEHHAGIVRDAAALRRLGSALTAARAAHAAAQPTTIRTTLEKLCDLADTAATTFGPPDLTTASGLHDLTWILTGQPPAIPPPTICHRTDGTALFYPGKVNGLFGDPESAKTWLAQAAGVEALNNDGTLAMIDVDHNGPDHTAARLILLGARPEHIADPERFRYYEPEEGPELLAAVQDITNRAPTVTIIDSLGEIFPMLGVNTNDGDEITTAIRQICTRPATAGSCVITIDHLPKSQEARTTGYAIGSIAKKRMIRGSYLRTEARTQPAPGAIGRITLRIEKDTAGELRKTSGGGYAGTFTLDSTQPNITAWTIGREDSPITEDGRFRPTHLMERISRYVEDNDQATQRDIRTAVKGKTTGVKAALEALIHEGYISTLNGPNNATLHHSAATYREAEDDTE